MPATIPKKKAKSSKGATAAPDEHIQRRVFVKTVRVGADPATKEADTTALLAKLHEQSEVETEKKEVASSYAEKLKDIQTQIDELVATLEQGRMEDMEVEEGKDFDQQTVTLLRVDTRAVIEKREMTEEDHQLELGGPVGTEGHTDPEEAI